MSDFPIDSAGRLVAEETPGDNSPALSVSELSGALKRTIEDRFGRVRVRGEISGWKRASSGHGYLALKDDKALIDGVIWKGSLAALRFQPEDGIEIIATGKLTTYPGRSKYQIVIDRMELAGAGALMALLEQRRLKLAAEGLFDTARKRPLPYLPERIGVITSPTGAVIRDILHRLEDRFPRPVLVWPVVVQGDQAAGQVAGAIAGFNALPDGRRPDLLIVARGGGSIEDLWAFNEEIVVRAVAGSAIPVISAVGHETDTTLCDFAADMRAPTPTAAAEIAVPVRADLRVAVRQMGVRVEQCMLRGMDLRRERATGLGRRLPTPRALLGLARQRADEMGERLPRALAARVAMARGEFALAAQSIRPQLLARNLDRARERLASVRLRRALADRPVNDGRLAVERLWRVAASLDPRNVLKRGYAMVTTRDGAVIGNSAAARDAGSLLLSFADGSLPVSVDGTRPVAAPKRAASSAPVAAQPKLL